MGSARLRSIAIAAAIAAVVLVPLGIWAGSALSGDDGEDTAELELEVIAGPPTGPQQLVVTMPAPELNTIDTTGGESTVTVECVDAGGELLLSFERPFPFTDTDGGALPPHVHELVSPEVLTEIERCRLAGTEPLLEGTL